MRRSPWRGADLTQLMRSSNLSNSIEELENCVIGVLRNGLIAISVLTLFSSMLCKHCENRCLKMILHQMFLQQLIPLNLASCVCSCKRQLPQVNTHQSH
jgi:hypothetical protein